MDTSVSKEELIKQCRYYSGGDDNPYSSPDLAPMGLFWWIEKGYVETNGAVEGENEYYEAVGGKRYPGIPYPILIALFTSWGKYAHNIKAEIANFYKLIDEYLSIPSDHVPMDKIPGT